MKYRMLGSSTLRISEIALGNWMTASGGIDKSQATACVHRALDVGITLFDTANSYGMGAAELLLGEALAGMARDSYVLATKVFYPMGPNDKGLSRAQVIKQLDGSLRRLRVDHVDLYQCHRYDDETPLEETMRALTEIVRQGKARFIGFSRWPPDKIRAALALPGVEKFVASQPRYSLLSREAEAEVFPLCDANGISQIVYSPLAQGLLTGKYKPDIPKPAGSRAADPIMGAHFPREKLAHPTLSALLEVTRLAARAEISPAQFALAWVLRRREVSAAIVGATIPDQVAHNAASSGANIDQMLFNEAESILTPFGHAPGTPA